MFNDRSPSITTSEKLRRRSFPYNIFLTQKHFLNAYPMLHDAAKVNALKTLKEDNADNSIFKREKC